MRKLCPSGWSFFVKKNLETINHNLILLYSFIAFTSTMTDIDIEFDNWNEQKKKIDKTDSPIAFKERDVFFLKMGKNVRYEQNGKGIDFSRPVVVIKKFNSDIFWGMALTSKQKIGPYYYNFYINDKPQCAIISQLRLFDKNRLLKKIGMINETDFLILKQKIKDFL